MVGIRTRLAVLAAFSIALSLPPSAAFAKDPVVPDTGAKDLGAKAPAIKPPSTASGASKPAAPLAAKDANTLFEGYSKILLGGVHVGFTVQRYEFDPAKKEFINTYLLKTNAAGGNITESVKARCTEKFKPIAYQYTSIQGGKPKTIDATFSNDVMTAIVKEGTKATTLRKDMPKGAFLSGFLAYMMLNGPEGIKPGVRYGFVAVAEEDAAVYPGEAAVAGQETVNGMTVFKVLNTFKKTSFVSYMNAKGDVISTRAPVQSITTELVGSLQEATAGQSFTPATLSMLFGNIPQGKINAIGRQESNPAPIAAAPTTLSTSTPTETPTETTTSESPTPTASPRVKGEGIHGGRGVILKGGQPGK